MCGRFLNKVSAAEIARISGTRNDLPNYPGVSLSRRRTIITGEPNDLVAPIHNRMPVILPREWREGARRFPGHRHHRLAGRALA